MVGTRLVYGCLLVLAALLLGSCAPDAVALRQGTVGRALTVEGTTGQIVADRETATHSVFTLRDNYGDIAYVRVPRSSGRGYPVMRVTYRVTGTLARGDDGAFLLRETARYRVYDPFRWVLLLAGVALAGALLAIVVVRCLTRRQVERLKKELPALLPDPAPGGPALMPPWGRLVVETGPDVGKVFELREARITIGRDVPDAALDVLLAGEDGVVALVVVGSVLDVRAARNLRAQRLGCAGVTIAQDPCEYATGSAINSPPQPNCCFFEPI